MRRSRRLLVWLVLPTTMLACTTWRPIPPGPRRAAEVESHNKVRVTLVTDSAVEVREPRIEGPDLVGFGDVCAEERIGLGGRTVPCEPVTIPIIELREIAAKRFSAFNTLVLVASLAGIGAFLDAKVNPGLQGH